MKLRASEIFVQERTRRRLKWILAARKSEDGGRESEQRILTVDEIADGLLNAKIEADYPQILGIEKEWDAMEKLIAEKMNSGPPDAKA